MPLSQSENPSSLDQCTAPLMIALEPNSPVLAGVITPLEVRSLKTNQLPGGSMLWILSDAPSERRTPFALTAGGASDTFDAVESRAFPDVVLAAVVVPPEGHCAWGAMQFTTPEKTSARAANADDGTSAASALQPGFATCVFTV